MVKVSVVVICEAGHVQTLCSKRIQHDYIFHNVACVNQLLNSASIPCSLDSCCMKRPESQCRMAAGVAKLNFGLLKQVKETCMWMMAGTLSLIRNSEYSELQLT